MKTFHNDFNGFECFYARLWHLLQRSYHAHVTFKIVKSELIVKSWPVTFCFNTSWLWNMCKVWKYGALRQTGSSAHFDNEKNDSFR